MGLLLHNWEEIVDIWVESVTSAETDAVQPFLE